MKKNKNGADYASMIEQVWGILTTPIIYVPLLFCGGCFLGSKIKDKQVRSRIVKLEAKTRKLEAEISNL